MSKKIAIVLAAGLGTRMKSSRPKVLHLCGGQTLISRVVSQLLLAGVSEVRVVLGHKRSEVEGVIAKDFKNEIAKIRFYEQKEQKGTADAVKSADIGSLDGQVLICNGDHPLILADDYQHVFEKSHGYDLTVVTSQVKDPSEFGRVIRDESGRFLAIKEARECSPAEKNINEVNTGLYVCSAALLKKLIPKIQNDNSKKEYYLTDLVKLAKAPQFKVQGLRINKLRLSRGVNNLAELALASRALFKHTAHLLMLSGVEIESPSNTWISPEVKIAPGAIIGPGSKIMGQTEIGARTIIEGQNHIVDSKIADEVRIRWGSVVEKSIIGKGSSVGPYGRLRPESELGEEVHIGNFVELKKTKMHKGAKAGHLSYLGDAEIGEETNIGCGTITCNYAIDKKKYKTLIGKNVFVGSDTQFVAPVKVGDHAVIGSGTTVTKDVPERALVVGRAKPVIKENFNKE